MLSYGELFLTLVAAAALFGPKDIPIVARAAGRFVGKAVGYMQTARGQLDDVMKRAEVDKVHKELQETMAQLEAIRYEIRTGISISNPGPLTRSIMKMDVKPDSAVSQAIQTQTVVAEGKDTGNLDTGGQKLQETLLKPFSDTQVAFEMQELQRGSSHIETAKFETVSTSTKRVSSVGFQPGPDGTFSTMPPSTVRIASQRVVVKPVGIAHAESPPISPKSTEGMEDITVLPISAVSAGLLPPRKGPLVGGAELVLESLTERQVAFETMEFLKQTDPTVR